MAAEARAQFAAWEGDAVLVQQLAERMLQHYGRFKLDPIYVEVWLAIAARCSPDLDKALPAAERAYNKAGRRKTNDIWGGGKAYNESMIDIYMTCALKIAKNVGMSWEHRSEFTDAIWPAVVIDTWQ